MTDFWKKSLNSQGSPFCVCARFCFFNQTNCPRDVDKYLNVNKYLWPFKSRRQPKRDKERKYTPSKNHSNLNKRMSNDVKKNRKLPHKSCSLLNICSATEGSSVIRIFSDDQISSLNIALKYF